MTVYTNYTTSAQTTDYATQNALQLYANATYQGAIDKVLSLVGRGRRALATMSKTHTVVNNGAREAVRVPLQAICGSANGGRTHDFDTQFRPMQTRTQDRWLSVAVARQRGRQLPPVELVQVNDSYYIVDGHHRVSVAAAMQDSHIDAVVVVAH